MIDRIPARLIEHDNEVLTSNEVADLLKVHLSSVRRWSRLGKLKGYRLGGGGDWAFLYSYNCSNLDEGGDYIES